MPNKSNITKVLSKIGAYFFLYAGFVTITCSFMHYLLKYVNEDRLSCFLLVLLFTIIAYAIYAVFNKRVVQRVVATSLVKNLNILTLINIAVIFSCFIGKRMIE